MAVAVHHIQEFVHGDGAGTVSAGVFQQAASFTVLVVNAQHIKTVPGRKTDVKLRHEVALVAVETA